MKNTLSKVLSAQPRETFNTASTINLEDDQGYFGSYSSVDIHYEMLKVNKSNLIFLLISNISLFLLFFILKKINKMYLRFYFVKFEYNYIYTSYLT